MPLHLLGKKSWNVYNADNIARVKRDEAEARAREEAEEQRMQEVDAARRLAILRGETPPPLEPLEDKQRGGPGADEQGSRDRYAAARDVTVRKRKRHGEDDTDFEMRVARERVEEGNRPSLELAPRKPSTMSLVDDRGHISLFNEQQSQPRGEGEIEGAGREGAGRQGARKRRKTEEEQQQQQQTRFADAAGKGISKTAPWYATPDDDPSTAMVPFKNVFGKDDPRRKVREAARLDASDPLAMMKRGAAKVRELDKARKRDAEERENELRALTKEQRRGDREIRRREDHDDRSPDRRDAEEPTRRERPRDSHRGDLPARSRHREEDRRSRREEDRQSRRKDDWRSRREDDRRSRREDDRRSRRQEDRYNYKVGEKHQT